MSDIDLDAVEYTYKRLNDPDTPLTPEDIAYISGRLEEFLRAHGYVHDDEAPRPQAKKNFIEKLLIK